MLGIPLLLPSPTFSPLPTITVPPSPLPPTFTPFPSPIDTETPTVTPSETPTETLRETILGGVLLGMQQAGVNGYALRDRLVQTTQALLKKE